MRYQATRTGGLRLAAGIFLFWLTAFAGVLLAVRWWAAPSWHALATAAS
jgi:hypothetical protein